MASSHALSERATTSLTRGWASTPPTTVGARFQAPVAARQTNSPSSVPASTSAPRVSIDSTSRPSRPSPSRAHGPRASGAVRTPPWRRSPQMPARIRAPPWSNARRDTKRSEKPSLDAKKLFAASALRSTPTPSVPSSTTLPGSASTELMTRSLRVACAQAVPPSRDSQSPSVVPASNRSASSGRLRERARAAAGGGDAADLRPLRRRVRRAVDAAAGGGVDDRRALAVDGQGHDVGVVDHALRDRVPGAPAVLRLPRQVPGARVDRVRLARVERDRADVLEVDVPFRADAAPGAAARRRCGRRRTACPPPARSARTAPVPARAPSGP